MCQVKIIGCYTKESELEQEINNFIKTFDYDNLDIKYQMVINESELLYSALIIVKDCS